MARFKKLRKIQETSQKRFRVLDEYSSYSQLKFIAPGEKGGYKRFYCQRLCVPEGLNGTPPRQGGPSVHSR